MITRYRTEAATFEVNDGDQTYRVINPVGNVETDGWEPYEFVDIWDFDNETSLLISSGRSNLISPRITGVEREVIPLELDG